MSLKELNKPDSQYIWRFFWLLSTCFWSLYAFSFTYSLFMASPVDPWGLYTFVRAFNLVFLHISGIFSLSLCLYMQVFLSVKSFRNLDRTKAYWFFFWFIILLAMLILGFIFKLYRHFVIQERLVDVGQALAFSSVPPLF